MILLAALLITGITNNSSAQVLPWAWTGQIGGHGGDYYNDVTTDASGFSYTVGRFKDTVTVGSYTHMTRKWNAFVITKRKPNGAIVWSRDGQSDVPLTGDISGTHIVTDKDGNLIMTIEGIARYISYNGYTASFLNNNGGIAVFKLDTAGAVIWSKTITESQMDYSGNYNVSELRTDKKGNIYIAGSFICALNFMGSTWMFTDTAGHATHKASDGFLAKISPTGVTTYATRLSYGPLTEGISGLAVDDAGNAYVTGTYGGKLKQGSTIVYTNPNTDSTYSWGYLAKFDVNGMQQWVKNLAVGTAPSSIVPMRLDMMGNDLIIAGMSANAAFTFGPGISVPAASHYNPFYGRLRTDGTAVWMKYINYGSLCYGTLSNLKVASSSRFYLSGTYNGTIGLSSGITIGTNDMQDFFVMDISDTGLVRCAYNTGAGAPGTTTNCSRRAAGMTVDPAGNLYVCGEFTDTMRLSPSLVSHGASDGFLAKLGNTAIPAGIGTIATSPLFSVYPNPSHDRLQIETTGSGTAVLFNSVGQTVAQMEISATKSTMDINRLPQGVYLLQIKDRNGVRESVRVVKD